MADPTAASFRHTLRFLCATLMASQVVLLMAVAAGLGASGFKSPPVWAVAVVVAVGIAGATVIPRVGYRVPAIAPGADAEETRRTAARAVQNPTLLRFAIAETVTLISIVLAFVVDDGGTLVSLLGVAFSLVLCGLHVWPSERVLTRTREALEREGGLSRLDEVMDAPPPSRRG